MPVIQALSATPANRDVRVHDLSLCGKRVPGTQGQNLISVLRNGKMEGIGINPRDPNMRLLAHSDGTCQWMYTDPSTKKNYYGHRFK
jgi:hypothetical protein